MKKRGGETRLLLHIHVSPADIATAGQIVSGGIYVRITKGGNIKVSNLMMTAAEVAEVMDCCESLGYKMIRELNAELKAKGYITRNARIPRKYFYERVGFEPELQGNQETAH